MASLLDFTAPRFEVLAEIGVVQLPRTGRIIKVRMMDAPDGTGAAIDVREFMLDEFWHSIREAQARPALTGRKISGRKEDQRPDAGAAVHRTAAEGLVAPTSRGRGVSELLALAVVKAEASGAVAK